MLDYIFKFALVFCFYFFLFVIIGLTLLEGPVSSQTNLWYIHSKGRNKILGFTISTNYPRQCVSVSVNVWMMFMLNNLSDQVLLHSRDDEEELEYADVSRVLRRGESGRLTLISKCVVPKRQRRFISDQEMPFIKRRVCINICLYLRIYFHFIVTASSPRAS